jgi:hypothetical protein
VDFDTTKMWVKFCIRGIEGGIGEIKFQDIFRIEPLPIEVDHTKCWTPSVKGFFDIKVVASWSSSSESHHLRKFTTEGVKI